MADLKPLIEKYDCFAWVPTIRGALSLDLIDNSRNLLGDVDKYSVAIRHHKGLTTEQTLTDQDMCLWLKQKGTQWIFGVILAVAVAMVIKGIVQLMTI